MRQRLQARSPGARFDGVGPSRGCRRAGTRNDRRGESFPVVRRTGLYGCGLCSYGLYSSDFRLDLIARAAEVGLRRVRRYLQANIVMAL